MRKVLSAILGLAFPLILMATVAAARPARAIINASPSASATVASGACAEGYSNHCSASSGCECIHFKGVAHGSFTGKARAVISLTRDVPFATDTTPSCVPFFADISLDGGLETADLSAAGVICDIAGSGSQLISGGYSVASQANGLSGSGELTGTLKSNNRIRLELSGALVNEK